MPIRCGGGGFMMPLSTELNPAISEAAMVLKKAVRSRSLVLAVGDCRVDYEGRASSTLDWGERVTMIKQDGSVLVHRPVGYEPVNWQPARCLVRVSLEDPGALIVTASRHQPRETISIEFREIELLATGNLHDSGEFALHVTEEQMKQAILVAPELVEEGLKPLEVEKSLGQAGFTDIYAEDSRGNLVVVEIKRNPATKDAVMQLQRYLETVRTVVSRPVRGIVAAPQLRKGSQPLLDSLKLEFVKVSPERCLIVLKSQRDMKLSHFLK
jgi:RecB family endonuclease NucS